MMKHVLRVIFLFISLFCIVNNGYSQSNFAPIGAFWNYNYYQHNGFYISQEMFRVDSIVNINGIETKLINNYYTDRRDSPTSLPYEGVSTNPIMLQKLNDSIFTYLNYNSIESRKLLYSFKMVKGDTMHFDNQNHFIAIVDTVYDTIIDVTTLKKWKLTKYCNSNFFSKVTLIEDIGFVDDGFLGENWDGCIIGGGEWRFGCYSSSTLNYNTPCQKIVLDVNDNRKIIQKITVYPNPVKDILHIVIDKQQKNVQLNLIDALGNIVKSIKYASFLSNDLDISNLTSGKYLLTLTSDELNYVQSIPIIK